MITAILLAAGRSRRMGSQKLLLPLGGKQAIARIAEEVLAGPVDDVVAVVRQGDQEVARTLAGALAGRAARVVANPDDDGDMLSSVRCGLRAMPPACDAVLVVLGDQPGISRETVADLIRAFCEADRGIVVPTFDGRRGHPILFSTRYCSEVLSQYEARGLRGLLEAHPGDVLEVESARPEVVEDMDTPADYRRISRRFSDPSG
jgi:molybdenum cofactor cytidylyltransferase